MSLVEVERDGAVAVVLLNRPDQLNALSDELMAELVSALQELDRDEDAAGHAAALALVASGVELSRVRAQLEELVGILASGDRFGQLSDELRRIAFALERRPA